MSETLVKDSKEILQSKPLVFISHDTRDSVLAEAFSKLLSSVSAGVLKSFRSSDKRGTQGIEYGVEWYPEIMKKLQEATDVVCLLTENSLNRPWVLFEAGVAKGKLDTPILGVGIGIQHGKTSSGPFAQFQNCSDDEDALIKLVTQLVKKIPNSEPDEDVIKSQVKAFKEKAAALLSASVNKSEENNKDQKDDSNVANLYEEIKIMFQDLPIKLGRNNNNTIQGRSKKILPRDLELVIRQIGEDRKDLSIIVALGVLKDEFPWIYDLGQVTLKTIGHGNKRDANEAITAFEFMIMVFNDSRREINNSRRDNENEEYVFHLQRKLPDMFREYMDNTAERRMTKQRFLNREKNIDDGIS